MLNVVSSPRRGGEILQSFNKFIQLRIFLYNFWYDDEQQKEIKIRYFPCEFQRGNYSMITKLEFVR